jgi:hypothetical protein
MPCHATLRTQLGAVLHMKPVGGRHRSLAEPRGAAERTLLPAAALPLLLSPAAASCCAPSLLRLPAWTPACTPPTAATDGGCCCWVPTAAAAAGCCVPD